MHVISARNVAAAWAQAVVLVREHGVREDSRNGPVLVVPTPVATVYDEPRERVLLDPVRDCNPFFHVFEALWMLAGRRDGAFLCNFVGDFAERYAEPDGNVHGAYGARWRDHFPIHWNATAPGGKFRDQLAAVVKILREDPDSRQAVIQMWDPTVDLAVPGLKDRPCNQSVMLRVREALRNAPVTYGGEQVGWERSYKKVLDITVTCRSNDVVWGCYGANAVHFSYLHEYLAAMIGVDVGTYVQFSNNWHLYDATAERADFVSSQHNAMRPYPGHLPLVAAPECFDEELREFVQDPDQNGPYDNAFFAETARPMWRANVARRERKWDTAVSYAEQIAAPDWRRAALDWLDRRLSGSRRDSPSAQAAERRLAQIQE